MKNIKIGIFFGTILHQNMGCNALIYSFIQLCEEIGKLQNWHFQYTLYWDIPSSFNKDHLPMELNGYDISFMKVPESYLRLWLKGVLKDKMHDYNQFYQSIKSRDFFVDTCGGDSFSDIYGSYTLKYISKNHALANKFKKPVIFLPQTIGPFNTAEGEKKARKMMEQAVMCYVRDDISEDVAAKYISRDKIVKTIDMAFHMAYPSYNCDTKSAKRRIGVSPSALLWNGGYTGKNQFGLKSNYKSTIHYIIEHLLRANYQVVLLAHVLYGSASQPREDDYWLCKQLQYEYPGTELAPFFYTPTEAKSFISTLDGLMSSRMHCCIGAYSSGVPVFTLGYSRKFNGLFADTLKYGYGSDLRNDDTEVIIQKLCAFLYSLSDIKKEMPLRLNQIQNERLRFIQSLTKVFEKCINM